jgi:hypothetical protein
VGREGDHEVNDAPGGIAGSDGDGWGCGMATSSGETWRWRPTVIRRHLETGRGSPVGGIDRNSLCHPMPSRIGPNDSTPSFLTSMALQLREPGGLQLRLPDPISISSTPLFSGCVVATRGRNSLSIQTPNRSGPPNPLGPSGFATRCDIAGKSPQITCSMCRRNSGCPFRNNLSSAGDMLTVPEKAPGVALLETIAGPKLLAHLACLALWGVKSFFVGEGFFMRTGLVIVFQV